jgi:hypothetical protein
MKRCLLIMILVILCFDLCGCGADEESQYDETTNQKISFQGINFQVPAEWEKPEVKVENYSLAFAEWPKEAALPINSLMLTFESDTNLAETLEDREYAIEMGEEQGVHLQNYKQTNKTIENMDAISVKYSREIKGQTYEYRELLLEADKGVISMVFSSTNPEGLKDFAKVVNSIRAK